MEMLLVMLIAAILTGCLTYVNNILAGLVPMTLHAERYMTTMLGTDGFTQVFNIFFGLGISLIVLKFLKKGFETYILWTEGDADADPLQLLTNFFKSLAVAISFPVLYGWLAEIVDELTNKLLTAVGTDMKDDFTVFINGLSSAGLFTGIVSLIFFIVFFCLYIQFLIRGLEILILRIGLPIACVGLLDSDKGVFRSYMQKFYQSTLAIVIQIVLAKLGVSLMLNGHVFWGLATISLSLKTPKFLQEFMIVSGGSPTGAMGTVYQSVRLIQMARRSFK